MDVLDTANFLGYTKIVWIDDHFNISAEDIAKLLIENYEISIRCDFKDKELIDELQKFEQLGEEYLDVAIAGVSDVLSQREESDLIKIREIFLEEETREKADNNKELSLPIIEKICRALRISDGNKLPFTQAEKFISKECSSDDSSNLYMIDLSEGKSKPERGLDILAILKNLESKGTAFLLTHNATTENESSLENEFFSRDIIDKKFAFSVIAKEKFSQDDEIENSLKSALKRVTLRKNLMKVLDNASGKIQESYNKAQKDLLDITPEQLEKHVIGKSLREGVSELHIIERSITSYLSYEIKKYFLNDLVIHENIQQIRKLKNIPIEKPQKRINDNLIKFRSYEIWEEGEFINSSYMPIFCGDIFEYSKNEIKELYILIGQPCDIQMREDGKRRLRTGFFLPIQAINIPKNIDRIEYCKQNKLQLTEELEDIVITLIDKCVELENDKTIRENLPTLKSKHLNYYIDKNKYSCSFSNYFSVNLNLLDCCSFNKEGKVYINSKNNDLPDYILQGISKCHRRFLEKVKRIKEITDIFKEENINLFSLSIDIPGALKVKSIPDVNITNGINIDWNLKRIGRLKTPYSTDILKSFMDVYSRNAFDMEYIDE